MWANHTFYHGVGEQISFGGAGVRGHALAAAGDPEIWSTLSSDQQSWIMATLATLNSKIVASTSTMCPGWVAPSGSSGITSAAGCFQIWFNNVQSAGAPIAKLRTDGVFDQDTLNALITTAQIHASDFPTPYPAASSKKLSTGAMVGIAAAGTAVLGGIAYAVYGGKHKSRRSKRRR